MDFDKVFTAFRNCISEPKCKDCPWEQCEQFNQKKVTIPLTLAINVLNLLKEQETTIIELQNAYNYLQTQFFEAQDKLLKEQEAVKPRYNARTNWYECGSCHYSMTSGMHCRSELIPAYKVGFCAKCGKAVNWDV